MEYPRGIIKEVENTESPKPVEILSTDLFDVKKAVANKLLQRPEIRSYNEFQDKGFYLDDEYDWQTVKDSDGDLILVPTVKE